VSAHPYHRMCGCSQCSRTEADEDVAIQDAIGVIAYRMDKEGETDELLSDLYDNGYAHYALARLLSNTDATKLEYGITTALQKLLRTLKQVNDSVEREMERAA
jgi:hypothetical protein